MPLIILGLLSYLTKNGIFNKDGWWRNFFNDLLDKVQDIKYFVWDKDFRLESGKTLKGFQLAYETYGNLNSAGSNAIVIFHALSGNSHAYRNKSEIEGWWDEMVGIGKPFDPSKYFIICANVLGSCYGSTGPSSINPETGERYGLTFPIITVHDIVKSIKLLIDYLGLKKILSVSGGSLGGFQALDWAVSFPQMTQSVIPVATASYATTFNVAFNEVQRQAIYSDPNWNNGNYYKGELPNLGLKLAREIGHITYLS